MGKYLKVNIFYPYDVGDWLNIFPDRIPQWGNYLFEFNQQQKECDFCIIYTNYNLNKYEVYCPPQNVIFIPCEPITIHKYTHYFLSQFGNVIGHRAENLNRNGKVSLDPLPWFLKKSFDELINQSVSKSKVISIITSTKIMNKGHEERLKFCYKLKEELGEIIDLWGRGIRDFDDKWDAVAPYKYSIAIENSVFKSYITEKIFDCTLALTYPIYHGASNVFEYLNAVEKINILDYDNALRTIYKLINDPNHYAQNLQKLEKDRQHYLYNDSPIPLIIRILETMNQPAKPKKVVIKYTYLDKLYRRMYQFKF
jgi:hypothetical protein